MIPLFSPETVRGMDARAIAAGRTPAGTPGTGLDLMERAAGHLARAVLGAGGRGYGLRAAFLCGKGNNGGDGLAAARRLLDAGAAPRVCLVGGEDDLSDDAAVQLRRYRARGGRLVSATAEALDRADVAVDCLLGTGVRGEPRPPYREAVAALNAAAAAVVACDLPTGVDADTGRVPGEAVRADVTLSLGGHKRGLWLWPARGYCGRLLLGDLGIVDDHDEPAARVLEPADVAALVGLPRADAHKRTRGVVVVLAGSPGMSGAATLVARGAMAAGAGLVTVATGERGLVAPTVPEALTVDVPAGDPDAAFDVVAGQAERADALAVGPGLGHDEVASALVRRIVGEIDVPLVLDADGLNIFRDDGDALARHAAGLLVATPHAQEFARLVGSSGHGVWAQRVALVPEKSSRWGIVLVAKGPGSLVAAPGGRVWVNPTGGAALATGGTGDVLTGMLATLVAQGGGAEEVAAGVYLHGLAGQMAGTGRTARSVTALDVAAAVPRALATLD